MSLPSIIAIDGPASSGKTTVSYAIGEKFGYIVIDTGIFYRAITWLALQAGIALDDHEALMTLTQATHIQIRPAPSTSDHKALVYANGVDITDHLRSAEVEAAVSTVSAVGGVRSALLPIQREVAVQGQVIMAGRDIGTVVLPDAHIKFYIDASLEERARRRVIQKQLEGQSVDLAEITAALARRDQIDSERAVSPLKTADDAIRILTDGKTVEETVAEIAEYLYRWAENSTNSAHENPQTT